MRRTVKIKADFPKEKMLQLLEVANDVFNTHVDWAFSSHSYNKNKAHKELYSSIREKYPNLPGGLVQSVRDMALESIKASKFKHRPVKSKTSGIRFDKRCCSIRGNLLSISTLDRREKVMLTIPKHFEEVFRNWNFTGLQLKFDHDKQQFFVCLNYGKTSPSYQDGEVLGIDRGLRNIVSCSNGYEVSGKKRNRIKRKRAFQRKALQAKSTRSAKRFLKRLGRREKRFSLNENHIISKEIVNLPYTDFILEKLSKMKRNKGKRFNRRISNWSYYQLEQLLTYKAEALGKRVCFVDARYTSQRCNCCGHIDRNNRNGEKFYCNSCGHSDMADLNAAKNIRDLWIKSTNPIPKGQAGVNQPNALPSFAGDCSKPAGLSCG